MEIKLFSKDEIIKGGSAELNELTMKLPETMTKEENDCQVKNKQLSTNHGASGGGWCGRCNISIEKCPYNAYHSN